MSDPTTPSKPPIDAATKSDGVPAALHDLIRVIVREELAVAFEAMADDAVTLP